MELEAFLGRGYAALLILLIVLLELAVLAWRYRFRDGPGPARWLSPLGAGGALVVALGLAQIDAPATLQGLALAVAGIAHLAGYRQRWSAPPE